MDDIKYSEEVKAVVDVVVKKGCSNCSSEYFKPGHYIKARNHGELVFCGNCGRRLYLENTGYIYFQNRYGGLLHGMILDEMDRGWVYGHFC